MGPKAKDPDIAAQTANQLLSYNAVTGVVAWRENRGGTARVGSFAGNLTAAGYLRVCVMGKQVMLHRLVWLMFYGAWPDGEIDHIDGNRRNNSIENLRPATRFGNCQNRSNKKALPKGVSFNSRSKTYRVRIRADNKLMYLGSFEDLDAAAAAYVRAASQYHAEFAKAA